MYSHDCFGIENNHKNEILNIMCDTLTARDNNLQMINRDIPSWLSTKLANHFDLNLEKLPLNMTQKKNHNKKIVKLNCQIEGAILPQ